MPATSRNLYGSMTKSFCGGELIAGESPVSEKFIEICFSSNVAGGSPTLKNYMETRLYSMNYYGEFSFVCTSYISSEILHSKRFEVLV